MRATAPVPQRASTPAPKASSSPERSSSADSPDFYASLAAAREARPARDADQVDRTAESHAQDQANAASDARQSGPARATPTQQSATSAPPQASRAKPGRASPAAQATAADSDTAAAAPAESAAGGGAASAAAATATAAANGKPGKPASNAAGKGAAKSGDASDDDAGALAALLPLLMGLQARAATAGGEAASGSAGGDAGGGAGGAAADTAAIGAAAAASGTPALADAPTQGGAANAPGAVRNEAALLDTLANALLGTAGSRDGAGVATSASHARADKADPAGAVAASGADAAGGLDGSSTAANPLDAPQLQSRAGVDASNANRSIDAPVGSAHWPDELASHLALMNTQGMQSAQLRLSPEHLGPLSVHIAVHDGAASVWFQAAQPDTRAALEHSLPRLRELFAAQGMALADAGVHREPPRDSRQTPAAGGVQPIAALQSVTPVTSATLVRLGLVDAYA